MKLDLFNNLYESLKERNFVKKFMEELSESIENNTNEECKWYNLLENDLTIYNNKIISKYRNIMIKERDNILRKYAIETKQDGEMLYVYDINNNKNNTYNLCNCSVEEDYKVITKHIEELPKDTQLGSVLRKQGDILTLDIIATNVLKKEINTMIKETIEQQNIYLDTMRIEGHKYEAGEKYSGRIWLYDLDNAQDGGMEGIEEIEFPKDLYQDAKEGDLFIYTDGGYHFIKD